MHVVISWDISNALKRKEIDDALKVCIAANSWVKPLTTFYVVKVSSIQECNTITERILAVTKRYPNDVHVIITPPMSGGTYSGWLPQNLWNEINMRAS